MGRREKTAVNRFEDGSRASIGDYYVDAACARLTLACQKEANLLLRGFTVEQITPMIFRDDDVAKLKAVQGLTAHATNTVAYTVSPQISMAVTFASMPAPHQRCFVWNDERSGELQEAIKAADALVAKWGAVKWMLRWFNRNATAGAVRAMWPSVLQLCPDSPAIKELSKLPSRYTNPQGLPALLPLVRTTASTVASMALLPDSTEARAYNGIRLAFTARSILVEGVDSECEAISLNL